MSKKDRSYPARDRLLSEAELQEAAAEVVAVMPPKSVALAGGVALAVYGSNRLTSDLDVISDHFLREKSFKKRGSGTLTFGGQSLFTPTGVPVDVIVRTGSSRLRRRS